eukprot:CAMPEP_0185038916 /NCGR_PEP_ID=MMETSP1103-20130426/35175_1 /TAXON_ID=36769 /ORGANISM="Paraphysomonas bandaiensis, Strain Caron Lab Isolate" /LENGTH=361 /DNA_ID=CAMNT_0027577579 /DNA_START=48 /DNA_END=1133 /DNA_ORIENTATION=+
MTIKTCIEFFNKRVISNGGFAFGLMKFAGLEKFGEYLSIWRNISSGITLERGVMRFEYCVPEHLCHCHPDSGAYLDLASVLALADEITTVLVVCKDKTFRPGVSVSLSGELYCDDIKAGQHIIIEAFATKIGGTLGFTEIYFTSIKDQLTLARATHVKYLKMGFIWDLVSPLIPLAIGLLDYYMKSFVETKSISSADKPSMQSLLNVTPVDLMGSSHHVRSDKDSPVTGIGRKSRAIKSFSMISHPQLLNHGSFVHGGALAMSIHESVIQYCVTNNLPSRRLRYMDVSYISPCKGKVSISVTPIPHIHKKLTQELTSTYTAKSDVVDSFRVVIKASSDGKHRKSKNSEYKVFVQALVILYA